MADQKTIDEHEKEILEFWKKDKTFQKSLDKTSKSKPYIFYDGPPFATGLPHYGHLLSSILKDTYPRFFTMNNRYVKRVWGWDCHGLPVENVAEKELGINSKDEIEKMGVSKFNAFCKSKVLAFVGEWKVFVDRIGRWVDFDNSYKTMDNEYIESVWWAFKELYEKGYLYEGEKILMYCPRCSTPLAKSEIAMDNSYRTVEDITVVIRLKIKNAENTYALAWTTTPWTLPSNLALTVNPNIDYVYLIDQKDGNKYILAKNLIGKFYKSENDYEIIKEVKGKDLEGLEYEPLYPYFKDTKNAFKFLLADFVTAEDGTGIVHTAPAFGEEDNLVCRKYKIPMVQPVDEKGNFTHEVTDYSGMYIHDSNEKIVADLRTAGKSISAKKTKHEYPFCYRCDTKLMYRALPAWFVDIQKVKDKLVKLNKKINWIPEFLREGRMQYNISNAPDWNVTRNRFWASAMPVWKSKSGKIKVIGSIEELKKYAKKLPKGEIDLHKDYLDQVELEIGKETYRRIPEVLDCWFESGSMTFAQFHYPFENKKFFEENFPSQFVSEYIAQTRTWFYYMIVLSAILFDKIPFENVLTTGTILAEDGQKMSKSKKNFPDPSLVLKKYGADAMRFYLLSSPLMNADDINFSEKTLEEIYKKILLLTYNVNNFYELYKDIPESKTKSKNIMDKWIISEINKLILCATENMNKYQTAKVCLEIKSFVDNLSTWYVRRARDRFNEADKDAKTTLKYVLDNFSRVIAPIMPFVSEKIYQTLYGKEKSVHLSDWPKADKKLINESLGSQMNLIREIVSIGLRARDKNQIGVKWPLPKVEVTSKEEINLDDFEEIIKDELNVKEVLVRNSKDIGLEVVLDINITKELEAEGYSREITRKIQALRKTAGLVKEERIELEIESEFDDYLKDNIDSITSKVGCKTIKIGKITKKFTNFEEGKIKDKKYHIGFNIV